MVMKSVLVFVLVSIVGMCNPLYHRLATYATTFSSPDIGDPYGTYNSYVSFLLPFNTNMKIYIESATVRALPAYFLVNFQ